MSCSSCDPWGGSLSRTCFLCKPRDGNANGRTGTDSTSFVHHAPTSMDTAKSVGTVSFSLGTPSASPYVDILADILSFLEGKDNVDATPMLKLATQAIEYELAERMLTEGERARANQA